MAASIAHDRNAPLSTALQSQDIVAGLGAAPRDLLAVSLALFEDSTLKKHLSDRVDALKNKLPGKSENAPSAETVSSLQKRVMHWMNEPVPDDELRLTLWMRLREALQCPPVTFAALRSARTASDDLVVATLNAIKPTNFEKAKEWTGIRKKREIPENLDALARQTLAELVSTVMQSDDAANAAAREALIREMKERISKLDKESQDKLLRAINARELNDDAIRTILLTGGGLAAFSGAVSAAGFSAYILAAQVSAFIPLMSGPALVSLVSVVSDVAFFGLATLVTGWWATRSANQKIQAAIALRVLSLLALNGISAGDGGLRQMTRVFARLPAMRSAGTLDGSVLKTYQADWALIAPAHRKSQMLNAKTAAALERPLPSSDDRDRWHNFVSKDDGAMQDMAGMSALTLGELLYNIYSLDPRVVTAADFSRADELSDPAAFAAFAHYIEAMGRNSHLGAISNLKGYVAERVVASQLVDQGHVVEFPELANEPGWDIAVDGVKFQVKNAADLGLLERHFDKGYEYPVLANAEVAQMLAKASQLGQAPEWADRVHFVEGYSQKAVQEVTDQTLDAGDAMLHPHVPVFAVTLGAIRQFNRYNSGHVTGSQAIQEVLLNGTVTAGLAVIGNYAGVGIGLLVFGPAGGLVLGAVLPIVSRSQLGRVKKGLGKIAKSEEHEKWEAETRVCFERLIAVLESGLAEKISLIKQRSVPAESNVVGEYLQWRIKDDVRFLKEAGIKLEAFGRDKKLSVEEGGEMLLGWLSTCTLHPAVYQKELAQWLDVLSKKLSLTQNISNLTKKNADLVASAGNRLFKSAKKAYQEYKSKPEY